MRYLHPVQMHEKFVTSGEYAIYAHGFSTQVAEAWSIHALSQPGEGESWFVRVDSDWRNDSGALILGEALITPDSGGFKVERIDLERFQSAAGQPLTRFKESYTFFDEHLQVGYLAPPATERRYAEQAMPRGTVAAPRWRYFHLLAGFAVATAATRGTLTPNISPERPAFTGFDIHQATFQTTQLTIQPERRETLTVGLQKVEADVYTMRYADQPDQPHTLWLDRHGILLRQNGGLYEVSLIQYARRPDSKLTP